MEQNMDQKVEQKVARIIPILEERLPKIDIVAKGNHYNKYSINIEQSSINNHILGGSWR